MVHAPGISVVVPSCHGSENLAQCLRSLAAQTLDRSQLEVVLVRAGGEEDDQEVIAEARQRSPTTNLRVVRLAATGTAATGTAAARHAGVTAARHEYVTFVDDRDWVSASFLEVLLAHASPGVLPVAPVIDDATDGAAAEPADLAGLAAGSGGGAVATALVRALPYDLALAGEEMAIFWLTVLVRGGLTLRACPPAADAVYYRTPADNDEELTFEAAVDRRLDTVARLEALSEVAEPDTRMVLAAQIGARADVVGSYLRRRPADHPRVVTALDRRPIFQLPYRRINQTLADSLAIAYAFPPYADTSAIVSAKRLRSRGDVVDVIFNAMDRIRVQDNSLRRISGPFVARESTVPTPSYFSDWGSMERFATEGLAVAREWTAASGLYRRLYSRAHFAASHFLAAAYKLRNPGVRWSAEFSDPLSRDVLGEERGTPVQPGPFLDELRQGAKAAGVPVPRSPNCFVWAEELTYALADELIFTNTAQLEYMLGYCSNPEVAAGAREKAVISPQPTLPPEFYAMADPDYQLDEGVANLAYFGNFYATRGLDEVLRALALLAPATRARLRLHVFTSEPAPLRRRVEELGITELVQVGPYQPYLAFLALTSRFDCLLVNDATTGGSHSRNPYLPSKWSDYLGSGRPVWGLVEAGSVLSVASLAYRSPIGDVDAAGRILARIAVTAGKRHAR